MRNGLPKTIGKWISKKTIVKWAFRKNTLEEGASMFHPDQGSKHAKGMLLSKTFARVGRLGCWYKCVWLCVVGCCCPLYLISLDLFVEFLEKY